MTNAPPTSLHDMAEEIFALTVHMWRERLATKNSLSDELSESQFLTLDLLHRASPQNVGELQRSIGVLPAQMSRIIRSLESGFDKPLIRCELNPQDKRKIDVSLTNAGHRLYDEFRENRLAKTAEILARLAENDRTDFVRICREIKEFYRAAAGSSLQSG